MIVSFEDYVPTPRYDGLPWTQITIEESALSNGPWTLIDTQNLAPLDADPTSPAARSFTTHLATLNLGWYRVSFKDAAGDILQTDPRQNAASSPINYKPSVGQVARKVLSRTRDKYGNQIGDFTNNTTPTDEQVVRIIDDVSTEVADSVGDVVPDPLVDDAANVLAIRAAMQVELDFFSEQVNSGRSIYPQLKDQYASALSGLQRQITLFADGETTVTDSGAATGPSFSFPDSSGWLDRVW